MTDRLRAAAEAALRILMTEAHAPTAADKVEEILRAALAEQEAEPVELLPYDAGLLNDFGGGNVDWWWGYIRHELAAAHEFYQEQIDSITAPPRREWVSLTDEEQARLYKDWMDNETTDSYDLMHSVEAALKEKNA